MTDAIELVKPLLAALGDEFYPAVAPDGTPVLSTPFRYFNGDPIEVAVWEDAGALRLSDRGGLSQSLLLRGLEVLRTGPERQRISALLNSQQLDLHGGTVVGCSSNAEVGRDIRRLLQALVDAQVAVRETEVMKSGAEPPVYGRLREVLDHAGARYRENMRVAGHIGRRYPVDFQLAVRTEDIIRAVIVIANDRTLEMAERWNFRFRDIRHARPHLHRLFLVGEDTPWSKQAHLTISEACEAVFAPGEEQTVEDYLRTAQRIA